MPSSNQRPVNRGFRPVQRCALFHSRQFPWLFAPELTTASVALKRLVACSAKNRFYRANRDLGRVFKTEFLLSYLSEPQLRARIRRGLLKVEQLHALARDVYSGRRRAGSTLVSYTSR